ncbi:MAG: hypothetical protein Q8R79_00575, partial [Legionellaceae bacterium]|nr:hypothetical protein [Legionellaceae bacterium]
LLGFTLSPLGAIATIPLFFYWICRGLLQLTYGGQAADPSDKYTFWALPFVLLSAFGALGGVTNATGAMFAQLGLFALFARVISAILYGICVGTPGMARVLRGFFAEAERPLLPTEPIGAIEAEPMHQVIEMNTLPREQEGIEIARTTNGASVAVPVSPRSLSPHRFFEQSRMRSVALAVTHGVTAGSAFVTSCGIK